MAGNQSLMLTLFDCEAIRFEVIPQNSNCTMSPLYFDFERIASQPAVLNSVVEAFRNLQVKENIKADVVCGVPGAAVALATAFSVAYDIPLVTVQKDGKVEGTCKQGDRCIIFQDTVTICSDIVEIAEALRKEGLDVHDCFVLLDRGYQQKLTEPLRPCIYMLKTGSDIQ